MAISRRVALLSAAAVLSILPVEMASAGQYRKFDTPAFFAAQKAGKKIVVFFYAPWCPYCLAQKPILEGLLREQKYKDLVLFEVDYDSQKDVSRMLNIRQQSTIIVFKGTQELTRTATITERTAIAAVLDFLV